MAILEFPQIKPTIDLEMEGKKTVVADYLIGEFGDDDKSINELKQKFDKVPNVSGIKFEPQS